MNQVSNFRFWLAGLDGYFSILSIFPALIVATKAHTSINDLRFFLFDKGKVVFLSIKDVPDTSKKYSQFNDLQFDPFFFP